MKESFEELVAENEQESSSGYFSCRAIESRIENFEEKLDKCIELMTNRKQWSPHRHIYLLKEALTTSDFPLMFGNVLDRALLARYRVAAPDWREYSRQAVRRDMTRPAQIFKTWGAEGVLSTVNEKGEYPASKIQEAKYTAVLQKYGRSIVMSWETLLADDLGVFTTIPDRFARAALRTEWRVATSQFVASTGPHTNLYGATVTDVDGVAITNKGTLTFSATNLDATLALMAQQVDADGEPIEVTGIHLVVPPKLALEARAVITSSLRTVAAAGTTDATYYVPTANVLSDLPLRLHVNKYLRIIDTSSGRDKTWYVFADPAEGPAFEVDFLAGYETPQVVMKASDKVTIGGAPVSPFDGDFHSDNVRFRVRHICGGTQLDPRFTYAQVGS
jgi:hypothetical protein